MNRLQKKCLIATAGFHLLLVLVIVFGSAFFVSRTKPDETQVLTVIPANLIEAAFNSGVKAAPPPAPQPIVQPQPPAPQPPPPQPPAPTFIQRVKEIFTPIPEKLPPDDMKPVATPDKPVKPAPKKISLTPVIRNVPQVTPDTTDADARVAAKLRAAAIARAAQAIRENASPSTTVEMSGTGSVSYAEYGSAIKSIYDHAWILPGSVDYGNATTKIKVVISRNGQVISSQIVKSSGNSTLDDSVQRALDRVTDVPPFPEGDMSREHTYNISFNPLTKQMSE
jgi:TonB family protein